MCIDLSCFISKSISLWYSDWRFSCELLTPLAQYNPNKNIMSKLILNRYKGKPPITVLIDDEDYPKVSKYIWHIMALGYINGSVKNKRFYLHRFIMNAPSNKVVDHINGNKLDNRKCNLRLCSIRDNVLNCKISKNIQESLW